jgi:hypothetical protein
MMARLFTVFGLAALTALAYVQHNSWSLFDESAQNLPSRSAASSGRSYHK